MDAYNHLDSVKLYDNISEDDDYETVVKKVFQSCIRDLEDTLNILEINEYKRAVEAIMKAERIVLCGTGDAANVARFGFQKFIRIGKNVHVAEDTDLQLITASHLKEGDVLIVISHSGRTKSIVELVKYIKNKGPTIICITNFPLSPLAKNSDIILLTAAFAEHLKGEVLSKRVTELCILESLFVNVFIKMKEEYAKSLEKSNTALQLNKL